MQDKLASSRLILDQRAAQLELVLRRCGVYLRKVPLERWKWLATLILVIWLSHSLARFFWLIAPSPVIPPASVSLVVPSSGGSADGGSVNIESLKSLEIFGKADEVAAATEQTNAPNPAMESEAVDTKLNLVLRGVIASNDDASARAIIANGASQDVYAPGDKMPVGNGVTLAKVLPQRVILNNNGNYESLWMYQEDPNARLATATPYVADPSAGRSWPDENEAPAPESGAQSSQPMFVDKNYERPGQGSADPSAEVSRTLSDVVAMSIHREGGQVVGYKIRPGRNAEQFTALGLQPNDIVTAVNGVPLTSPGKVMEIYKNMSNATSASLEIKRGGSVLSVDVVLQ